MPDPNGLNTQLWTRYENYCQEVSSLEAKLSKDDIPPGKRGRLEFRLKDLRGRLIPELLRDLQI